MDTRYRRASYLDAVSLAPLDLVQEMEWENHVEYVSLEEAGLEEGSDDEPLHGQYLSMEGSIYSYTTWFHDGDDTAFSVI